MSENPILTVKDLAYSYRTTTVLSNISFSMRKGEICALLGPNGSGKTTLLKCVNGILNNGNGHIMVNGRSVSGMTRDDIARVMAVVPQFTSTVFSFTVLQMVIMGGGSRFGLTGRPGDRDYATAMEVLDELEIAHLSGRIFNELSGGERQLVLIARALFQKPQILLLDEPTSHLDFKKQFSIMQEIKRITEERNLATLITLHDPNLAGRYCSRLVMLKEGNIAFQGSRDSVFNQESLSYTYGIKVKIQDTACGIQFVIPDGNTG